MLQMGLQTFLLLQNLLLVLLLAVQLLLRLARLVLLTRKFKYVDGTSTPIFPGAAVWLRELAGTVCPKRQAVHDNPVTPCFLSAVRSL